MVGLGGRPPAGLLDAPALGLRKLCGHLRSLGLPESLPLRQPLGVLDAPALGLGLPARVRLGTSLFGEPALLFTPGLALFAGLFPLGLALSLGALNSSDVSAVQLQDAVQHRSARRGLVLLVPGHPAHDRLGHDRRAGDGVLDLGKRGG